MNVTLSRYDDKKHREDIISWYLRRDVPTVDPDLYPEYGVVCMHGDYLMGAMWLLRTDSPVAFLEYLILKPGIEDRELRKTCIKTMGLDLISRAKSYGHSIILASPKALTIKESAIEVGFDRSGEYLTLEVTKWEK